MHLNETVSYDHAHRGKLRPARNRVCILIVVLLAATATSAAPPQRTITNGTLVAKMYLPDPKQGYYRGTRFDWTGVIHSLTHAGHEYFGEWQKSDDPYLHDRITGPVESFSALQLPAGRFVRIGVGVCGPTPAGSKHPTRVVNPGTWKVTHGSNWIRMEHQVTDQASGLGYHYEKLITLVPQRAELVIDHLLVNRGKQQIKSQVYNHNFFVIDGQPTGPDFVVRFPFRLTADKSLRGFGATRGNQLVYLKGIPMGDYMISTFQGFGSNVKDHAFSIENRKTKASVSMVTDRPLVKLQLWSPHTTICPEPFIDLKVKPGHADRWSIRYTFATLK